MIVINKLLNVKKGKFTHRRNEQQLKRQLVTLLPRSIVICDHVQRESLLAMEFRQRQRPRHSNCLDVESG